MPDGNEPREAFNFNFLKNRCGIKPPVTQPREPRACPLPDPWALRPRPHERAARTALDIAEYLNLFELLAGGVNSKVFDLDTIDRIAGSRICSIASNYRPWIELRRQKHGQDKLYCELAALANAIRTRRECAPAHATEDPAA